MKNFILQGILFLGIVLAIILLSLFLIPNKRIINNSLYANIDKHHRLDSLKSPKIVFVGGSNMAFGLDSKRIEDSLHMPVVNMGLHAGFGLRFMLNEVRNNVQKGDIVVISPEYQHFYGDIVNGEKVLVALMVDVNRNNLKYLSFTQAMHLIPIAIQYAVSKLMGKQLDIMDEGKVSSYEKVFKRNSFNEYGDEEMHWRFPNQHVQIMYAPQNFKEVSTQTLSYIATFKSEINKRGVRLYIIPPAFQHTSFQKNELIIKEIEKQMSIQNTPFDIQPEVFSYPDSMFFNTAYHLDKTGTELRTHIIIQMLKGNTYKTNKRINK